jgi:hypothetical protein
MKHVLVVGALAVVSALALPAVSQPQEPALAAACAALPEALRGCAPATCQQPHPFMRSFTITHTVSGPDEAACAYTQSMPGDMVMSCRFSEAGRAEFALEVEEMLAGRMSGSTSAPASATTRECEVRDRNGNLVPWGNSGR